MRPEIDVLSQPERELLRDGHIGEPGDEWTEGRVIRAAVVRSLLTGAPLSAVSPAKCPPGGLRIHGATIEEELDLSYASRGEGAPLPALILERCELRGGLNLQGVQIEALSLSHSRFPHLHAPDLSTRGRLDLSHVGPLKTGGVCHVDLDRATLSAGLLASDATLAAPAPRALTEIDASRGDQRYALSMSEARISGALVLQPGFSAFGGVRISYARIDGDVWGCGALLVAGEGAALRAQGADVLGAVVLGGDERPDGTIRHFRPFGDIDLNRLTVASDVFLSGPTEIETPPWRSPEGDEATVDRDRIPTIGALFFSRARISGNVYLGGAEGPLVRSGFDLEGTRVGGSLELVDCGVASPEGDQGVSADGLIVDDDLLIVSRSAHARAQRRPAVESIGRPNLGSTLFLQEARIGGTFWLADVAVGYVCLDRAVIGGGGRWFDLQAGVIDFRSASVAGDLLMERLEISGLRLRQSKIGGALRAGPATMTFFDGNDSVVGGTLAVHNSSVDRLDLGGADIGGSLELVDVQTGKQEPRYATWSDASLRRMRVARQLHVSRWRVRSTRDEKITAAIEKIESLRRRRLRCYPGWWLVEATTRLPEPTESGPADAEPSGAVAEEAAGGVAAQVTGDPDDQRPASGDSNKERTAVLSFLWRDLGRGSWLPNGCALLLGGESEPFHVLNDSEPPRFGALRRRFHLTEYLVLFCSYVWGPQGPFRVVRRRDLDRLGFDVECEPDRAFPPPRVENLGSVGGSATPLVRCTVLYGGHLFETMLGISAAGEVRMTEDLNIGRIPGGLAEAYEPPFRITSGSTEGQPPGMWMGGIAFGPWWSPSSWGLWGQWRDVNARRHRRLAERMKAALRSAVLPMVRVDLSDSRVQHLADADGLAWGSRARLDLDGFEYQRRSPVDLSGAVHELGAHDEEKREVWQGVIHTLRSYGRRLIGRPAIGLLPAGSTVGGTRFGRLERWLKLQYHFGQYNRHEYRPQPYETLAAALRNEGATADARRVMSHKLTIERRVSMPWYLRPFSWLFWAGFDYGLSTTRAAATVLLFGFLGWAGTSYANRPDVGLLIVNLTPAATAVADGVQGVRPGALQAAAVMSEIPCGDDIFAPIYALDLMIPILQLGQEQRCGIRTGSARGTDSALRSPRLWEALSSIYKVLGAIILSIALLTFSGVLRRHAEA